MTSSGIRYERLMAASTIVVVPMILLFIFCRKSIVTGVSRGGLKGVSAMREIVLDLLCHADFSGRIRPSREDIGFPAFSAEIARLRAQNPAGTLLLDAGDAFSTHYWPGLPLAVGAMIRSKTDVMTLGNHEFDRGPAFLGRLHQRLPLSGPLRQCAPESGWCARPRHEAVGIARALRRAHRRARPHDGIHALHGGEKRVCPV